jgi:hypothetical protein
MLTMNMTTTEDVFVLFYEPAQSASASALPFPTAIITAATREGQNSLMV